MKILRKHNLLVAAIYMLVWVISLTLPSYEIFEFTGVEYEAGKDVSYFGYENLFDQVCLLIIGIVTVASGFGKVTIQKRIQNTQNFIFSIISESFIYLKYGTRTGKTTIRTALGEFRNAVGN